MTKFHTAKWYKENWGADPLKLGLPYEEAENPYYKSGPPMKLWTEDDVLPYRSEKEKQQHQKRSESAITAAETRRTRLIGEVEKWEIELQREPFNQVLIKAIDSYNRFHTDLELERGHEFEWASLDSDAYFLRRVTENYLRHQLSNYEVELEGIFGKTGNSEAYRIVRRKINAKIQEVYPELAQMMKNQL